MSTTAQYASTPIGASARINTANTSRDGTGTTGLIYTAPVTGARIDDISINAVSTTTAGMVRFFISDGANVRLWREVQVTAATPTASALGFSWFMSGIGLVLPSGYSLRASAHNAETFDIIVTRGGVL